MIVLRDRSEGFVLLLRTALWELGIVGWTAISSWYELSDVINMSTPISTSLGAVSSLGLRFIGICRTATNAQPHDPWWMTGPEHELVTAVLAQAVHVVACAIGGRPLLQQGPLKRLRTGEPTRHFRHWIRTQPSTSCSFAPFIVAALPYVDLGWTFNPNDTCATGGSYCKLHPYGEKLQNNKRNIGHAIDRILADYPSEKQKSYKALMLAVAMQESKFMDSRDMSKDGKPKSMNCSVLNVNCDMLERAESGVNCYAIRENNLDEVLRLLGKFFDQHGPKRSIDFIRGGSTGFDDGYGGTCNCPIYRRAIASIYRAFSDDPSLMTDGRRAEITVPGC